MGFDFGDIWNPVEQWRDLANKGSAAFGGGADSGDAGTYANVRGPDGSIVQRPSTYGQQLSQQTGLPPPVSVSDGARQALLAQQGGRAGMFADRAEQGYGAYGQQAQGALDYLQGQARGQNSVSAEQLRQALGQNQAAQMSMAAGASPQNASAAGRTAAIQMGRQGMGLAGQQATAGLAERNQANQQYGSLLGTLRGQDLSAATQSRQNALSGYGAGNAGPPQKSWEEKYGPVIAGAAATAASDRRLKTDVKDGGAGANEMLASLRAFSYRYKDGKKFGEGEYTGPMAQDLERAGSRAVIDTPAGKMVHGARLATENTAMLAALRDRVAKLEGKGKAA